MARTRAANIPARTAPEEFQSGDHDAAIADLTTAIELPRAPAELASQARFLGGTLAYQRGDRDSAIADFRDALASHDALADFFVILAREVPNAPKLAAMALLSRGVKKYQRGDHNGAIADTTKAIELPNLPAKLAAQALTARGFVKHWRGDYDGAIADTTKVIELPNLPAESAAQALVVRGLVKHRRGDYDGAIADTTKVIELPNAPAEVAAEALFLRGVVKYHHGDNDAITDVTAAIASPDGLAHIADILRKELNLPTKEAVAPAFSEYVDAEFRSGNNGAITFSFSFTWTFDQPGAPTEIIEMVREKLLKPLSATESAQ